MNRQQPKFPTDQALAAVVEKIIATVHKSLPKLKVEIAELVRVLTDDEWTKLRDAEDRRRAQVAALAHPS